MLGAYPRLINPRSQIATETTVSSLQEAKSLANWPESINGENCVGRLDRSINPSAALERAD